MLFRSGPYGGVVECFAVSGTNLFAGTYDGVNLSTNNGTSWTAVSNGLHTNPNVWSLAVSGPNLFACAGIGVYLSTNNGTSWTAVSNGLPTNQIVSALAVSGTNLFVGTQGSGVYLSTNNGTSWTAVNNGLTNSDVMAFAVSGPNLFAGTNSGGIGGIYLSTNNGTSWTAVNNGLSNYWFNAFAVSGPNLFVGTSGGVYLPTNGGVYLSTNNGTSWTAVSNGLPTNLEVYSLAVSGPNLFAGIFGAYVWKRPLSEFTGVSNQVNNLPQEFALSQNYPNPFNPATTINYSLAKEGKVKLTVYNAIGSKVATIVNEYKPAGNYSVQFNGSNLASGIYLYRLESGNYSAAKKFILLK